jgi:DNA-binding transcriptional regulator YbjK
MGVRAQLSQERSRIRREELLAAAIELFAEGGSRSITHRGVAARAGLPPATTTYYFESIEELILEALAWHIGRFTSNLEAIAQVDVGVDVTLDDAAGFVTTIFTSRGPEVARLELSIFLAAARVPELRDNAARAMRALEAVAEKVLLRVGVTEPTTVSRAMVALIAGTALRRQSGEYTDESEARMLASAIRDLVAAHALGPDKVDRAINELKQAKR